MRRTSNRNILTSIVAVLLFVHCSPKKSTPVRSKLRGDDQTTSIFAALSKDADEATPTLEVSVPKSESLTLCALNNQTSNATSCDDASKMTLQFSRTVGGRDIYDTDTKLSTLSTANQNLFLAVHGSKSQKFKISLLLPPTQPNTPSVTEVSIVENNGVYEPSSFTTKVGQLVRMHVTMSDTAGCGKELVIPSMNKNVPLTLNQPVTIEFTPQQAGTVAFTCGMGMYKGSIVVQ